MKHSHFVMSNIKSLRRAIGLGNFVETVIIVTSLFPQNLNDGNDNLFS